LREKLFIDQDIDFIILSLFYCRAYGNTHGQSLYVTRQGSNGLARCRWWSDTDVTQLP
jgi:hypothetical protein